MWAARDTAVAWERFDPWPLRVQWQGGIVGPETGAQRQFCRRSIFKETQAVSFTLSGHTPRRGALARQKTNLKE